MMHLQNARSVERLQALKVAARFHQALVMPPRQLVQYVGKFDAEFKRAQDKLRNSIAGLEEARKKYPEGAYACDKLLEELGLEMRGAFQRNLWEDLRSLEWAVDSFHRRVKERRITKVRNTDTLPQSLAEAIAKVLVREAPLPRLLAQSDPGKVKAIANGSDYEWNEKYEEGVSPEFRDALADLHSSASALALLLEDTEKRLSAFVTGELQPEKVETLYHASVKARQIYQNGFSTETPKDQLGLGGSQSTKGGTRGISFTYDLKAALDIARSFKEAAMIAVGDIKASTILDWGVRETELEDFVMHLKNRLEKSGYKQRVTIERDGSRWVVREDDEAGNLTEKGVDQIFKTPEAVFEVYDAYLWSHPTRLNPVHMNRRNLINYLKTSDPKDIGVVAASVDMTNPDIATHGGEREYRVPPSAVIEVTRFYQ